MFHRSHSALLQYNRHSSSRSRCTDTHPVHFYSYQNYIQYCRHHAPAQASEDTPYHSAVRSHHIPCQEVSVLLPSRLPDQTSYLSLLHTPLHPGSRNRFQAQTHQFRLSPPNFLNPSLPHSRFCPSLYSFLQQSRLNISPDKSCQNSC